MPDPTPAAVARRASTWSIVWGVLLIVLGFLAIGSPMFTAVVVSVVMAWLIMFAGAVHVVLAFHAHGAGSFIWKLLVGLAYIFLGAYLIMHPLLGIASLTLVLAVLFLIEGILDIVLYFKLRPARGSSWELIDGIVTVLLGLLIYVHWPSSSVWAIGTLVGVSMVINLWLDLRRNPELSQARLFTGSARRFSRHSCEDPSALSHAHGCHSLLCVSRMGTCFQRKLSLARGAQFRRGDDLVCRNVRLSDPPAQVPSGCGRFENSIRARTQYSWCRNLPGADGRPETPRTSPDVRHRINCYRKLVVGETAPRAS